RLPFAAAESSTPNKGPFVPSPASPSPPSGAAESSKPGQGPFGPSPASPSLVPTLSLPKGGGALRGIGEKFSANPVTGTGGLSIPIPLSPARAGFSLDLALAYDSGAGNGPFGLGWHLSLPQISRRTDKRLPEYRDAEESDVFVLSGAEDLVPE